MDKVKEILTKGVESKRKGNYQDALYYYNLAQQIDPSNQQCYTNRMKVLIGLEKYEQAFRNLLIVCHFNIADDLFSKDPISALMYEQFKPRFYSHDTELKDNYSFEPELIHKAIHMFTYLKDLVYRADNLSYYMGHCYVGGYLYDDFIQKFRTLNEYFHNLNLKLLGTPAGQDFRGTSKEGYFLCIGFMYAHMNLNLSLKTKQEMTKYYLDSRIKIKKDIWNYDIFLKQT